MQVEASLHILMEDDVFDIVWSDRMHFAPDANGVDQVVLCSAGREVSLAGERIALALLAERKVQRKIGDGHG